MGATLQESNDRGLEQVTFDAAEKGAHPGSLSTLLGLSNNSATELSWKSLLTPRQKGLLLPRLHGPVALPGANTRSLCEFRKEQGRFGSQFPQK